MGAVTGALGAGAGGAAAEPAGLPDCADSAKDPANAATANAGQMRVVFMPSPLPWMS